MSFSKKIITAAIFLVIALALAGGSFVVKAQPNSNSLEISPDKFNSPKAKQKTPGQLKKNKAQLGKTKKDLSEAIDPILIQNLKKAQAELQTARTNLLEAKKNQVSNVSQLQTKVAEAKKAVQIAGSTLHQAKFKAKINSAKTLGIANYYR